MYAEHRGDGNIRLNFSFKLVDQEAIFNYIDTVANETPGIYAHHFSGNGDIDIDLLGAHITTTGTRAPGIYALHGPLPDTPSAPQNTGNIKIKTAGATINTSGDFSHGVFAYHKPETAGTVDLEVIGRITTNGQNARGVYGWQTGLTTGNFRASVLNSDIKTMGRGADGVFVERRWPPSPRVSMRQASSQSTMRYRSGVNVLNRRTGSGSRSTGTATWWCRDPQSIPAALGWIRSSGSGCFVLVVLERWRRTR